MIQTNTKLQTNSKTENSVLKPNYYNVYQAWQSNILTVGSVMSSRSAAWSSVLTSASTPPIWQTKLLLTWLLHVRFDKIPATHVTMLMSGDVSSWTSCISSPSMPSYDEIKWHCITTMPLKSHLRCRKISRQNYYKITKNIPTDICTFQSN